MLDFHMNETLDGHRVCRADGALDAFTVSTFRQIMAGIASSSQLIFDLSGITFIDAAGLGALVGAIRRTRECGGQVAVVCSRPTLVRLLRSNGFDRIVTIAETMNAAASALTRQADPSYQAKT
jgi:anti-sigma B factor antagonist